MSEKDSNIEVKPNLEKEDKKEEKEEKEENKESEESEEKEEKEETEEKEEKEEKEETEEKEEKIETEGKEKKDKKNKKDDTKQKNKSSKKKKDVEEKDSLNDEEEEDNKKSESDSESNKDVDSETNSEKNESQDKDEDSEDNEENDDEDLDDDDEDDDDDDKSSNSDGEKKKDPYRNYITSKVEYFINMENLNKGDYIYGIKENKFYKVVNYNSKNSNNADKFNITLSLVDTSKAKTKKSKNEMQKVTDNILHTSLKYENKNENKDNDKKLDISEKKEEEEEEKKESKKEEKENKEEKQNKVSKDKEGINEQIKEKDIKEKNGIESKKEDEKIINKEENNEDKKEDKIEFSKEKSIENNKEKDEESDKNKAKEKEKEMENKKDKKTNKKSTNNKKSDLTISIKDFSNYTFLQKINIFYTNYLNISHRIDMMININCSINDIIKTFLQLYHFYSEKYSKDKPPIFVFINNKRYSPLNDTKKKYFIPTKFDYKNDFLIILEKETYKFEEYDMGTRSNTINMKGAKVAHFVYSSYCNFQIDSFIISKNIPLLECEVYELKKEFFFNVDPENEKVSRKKIREFLDLNWKEKSTLISVLKSGAMRKSKENYDGNCFEINRKFILSHGKIYIFVVTASNKKIEAFNPRHLARNGLIIATRDDKGILNGFKAKRISDFIAY